MEILFCDLCNESVPAPDLDAGRAVRRKGRVICSACERAMSHSLASDPAPHVQSSLGPRPMPPFDPSPGAPRVEGSSAGTPAATSAQGSRGLFDLDAASAAPAGGEGSSASSARGRGNGSLWLASIALGGLIGAIFVLDDRLRAAGARTDELGARLAASEAHTADLARRLDEARGAAQTVSARLDESLGLIRQRTTRTSEEFEALRKDLLAERASIDALRTELAAARASAKSGEADVEKRFAELSLRLAKSEDERSALASRLDGVASGAAAAIAAGAAPQAPAVEPEAPWKAHVADLKSTNEGLRIQAIEELRKSLDPEVVQHLVPMLGDPNVFVRIATARSLGQLKAKPAIGPLIDLLEDVESVVREHAYLALRAITSQELKFDPLANESERAKRVKAWRDWFAKDAQKAAAGP